MTFFSRQTLRPVSPRRRTARLRLEPLEGRQLLSGFGPEDGAYIVEPWIGSYSDVQIQPGDQKIVAAGSTYVDPNNTTEQRMAIARYDSLGNSDNTYGSGGPSIAPLSGVSAPELGPSTETGWDLVLQPDGKAVVSGHTSTNSSLALARFNTSGTLDSGFGRGGWNSLDARGTADFFNPAEGVGLQSTGKVVVAASSLGSGNSYHPAEVARFTAGGVIDSGKGAFGQVVQGTATGYTLSTFGMPHNGFKDLAVQPDDKLVAVGIAYTDGTSRRLIVARYTASGTLDKTFNGSGYSVFLPAGISDAFGSAVALQSNGKIVVTGFCTGTDGANDMLVARYNSNGTLDTSFGGGRGYVRLDVGAATQSAESGIDVAIQPDGKIVVGGSTSVTGNPSSVLVARFDVNGTPDETFAPGGFKIGAPLPGTGYHSFGVAGVALQSDGSIIVAGNDDWDATGSNQHPLLMRFFGSQPRPLQAADGAAPAPSHAIPLTQAQVRPLLTQAIAFWQARGADTSRLGHVDVVIADLGGATLGLASGHTITLDDNAAGWGWLVGHSSRRGREAPSGRMDLLAALTHEVGHLLGHEHDEGGIMAQTLAPGVRQADDDQGLVAVPESGHDHPLAAIPQASSRLSLRAFRGRGRRPRFASRG